jgi:preprotein translocase subunit SecY
MKFAEKLHQIYKDHDLRRSILFVLGLLVVARIAAHIPIPGVDTNALKQLFGSNQVLGLLNVFSGGAMENFSLVALGIGPYITASIILQLLGMIIPSLEEIMKEGESGQKKINQWTRLLTIPLAFLQGFSMIRLLQQSGRGIIGDISTGQFLFMMVILTGGTMFLMWIGEMITEKKVGNGISLIILVGIVAGIPTSLQRTFLTFSVDKVFNLLAYAVLAVLTVAAVVFITEGQRNIPVSYAKRVRGNKMYGGFDTHLPLRVNQTGMIPIIFAVAIVMFPPLIAQMFSHSGSSILRSISGFTITLFNNQIFYGAIYFLLVFAFTYFYTAVVFHPHQIAENLQKQGGFVPGLRPGHQTADYLAKVSNRIMLAGALFLGAVAVLPLIMKPLTGISTMAISGASLLIVVSVVLETVRQIDSQLVMRDYEHL